MMKKGVLALGVFMFLFGLSGMADAVTGQGSFMIAAVVFAIGFGISLYNYVFGGVGNEKEEDYYDGIDLSD